MKNPHTILKTYDMKLKMQTHFDAILTYPMDFNSKN